MWNRVEDLGWKRPEAWGHEGISGVCVVTEQGHARFRGIEPIELMQFTGLHDKNGKEIYEGDCVRSHNKHFASPDKVIAVKYSGSGFILYNPQCCDACRKYGAGICSLDDEDTTMFEVIGNIYENPELLTHDWTSGGGPHFAI